jgi:hypothetical protein
MPTPRVIRSGVEGPSHLLDARHRKNVESTGFSPQRRGANPSRDRKGAGLPRPPFYFTDTVTPFWLGFDPMLTTIG